MTDDIISLELVSASGDVLPATVELEDRDWTEDGFEKTEATVTLRWPGGEAVGSDWHFFEALCRVREQLAPLGLKPRCYGACRNLVISGMAADMGRGLKGYLVRVGEPARQSDLVSIFDSGPEMDLVSVEEQFALKRQWLAGFGVKI